MGGRAARPSGSDVGARIAQGEHAVPALSDVARPQSRPPVHATPSHGHAVARAEVRDPPSGNARVRGAYRRIAQPQTRVGSPPNDEPLGNGRDRPGVGATHDREVHANVRPSVGPGHGADAREGDERREANRVVRLEPHGAAPRAFGHVNAARASKRDDLADEHAGLHVEIRVEVGVANGDPHAPSIAAADLSRGDPVDNA